MCVVRPLRRIWQTGVEFLARSLGGITRRTMRPPAACPAHKVTLTMPAAVSPSGCPGGRARRPKGSLRRRATSTAVEPVGRKPAQCHAASHPSHLYVTDDFIVTHENL